MAGYTSRTLLTLTVPSFLCAFVIWYLRKKRSLLPKLIESEKKIEPCKLEDTSVDIEQLDSTVSSMNCRETKLKESSYPAVNCSFDSPSEMPVKEITVTDAYSQTNVDEFNRKAKEVHTKSKSCENSTTCETKVAVNGKAVNGTSLSRCDKKDKSTSFLPVLKQVGTMSDPSENSSTIDTDLTNGVKALSLSDATCKDVVLLNGGDKSCSSDLSLSPVSSSNSSQPEANGKAFVRDNAEAEVSEKTPTLENVAELKDSAVPSTSELTCETNFSLKPSTPDSGLSAELHESDAGSSTLSEASSEGALNGYGDMLKSPVNSVASNDSGKEHSENQFETDQLAPANCNEEAIPGECPVQLYEFEIPQELCGLLIGRSGRHVKFIKEESNADISIRRHPLLPHLKTCCVKGTEEEIEIALEIIRDRFPLETFPNLSLDSINPLQSECTLPVTLKLPLPEGVTFDAILSATVSPGHCFLQQPTHPTYHTLSIMTATMTSWYNEFEAPKVFRMASDIVVVVPVGQMWYRALVTEVFEETEECTVKFLDYGGYGTFPVSHLRQLRFEFAQVPFQAAECFLGSITYPEGNEDWSEEAKSAFEELAQGQIIQGYIVGYNPDGVPYVHLYRLQGATAVFINRELVNSGHARWTENLPLLT